MISLARHLIYTGLSVLSLYKAIAINGQNALFDIMALLCSRHDFEFFLSRVLIHGFQVQVAHTVWTLDQTVFF
jgi:hypothetical protein